MVQTIYGLIAIVLVMLISLTIMRTTSDTQRKMAFNEVGTQITGVSVDILEHISRQAFDENTHEGKIFPLNYPLVTNANQLTPGAGFGPSVDCTSFYDPDCDDIDDFDGMTVERMVNGVPFSVDILVQYVDEDNPGTGPSGPSYAKEVVLTITGPYLLFGSTPLSVKLSRTFTYNRVTVVPAAVP